MKNDTNISPSEYEFFLEFYEKYKKLIYHFVRQCETKSNDVDDLVHDVILRLMNYIPNLMKISDTPSRVANYLSLTVKSVYVDRRRASQSEHCVVLPIEILEAIYEDSPH
jgi:DNA-directed RNA polymerase specialized sigma24 family protein